MSELSKKERKELKRLRKQVRESQITPAPYQPKKMPAFHSVKEMSMWKYLNPATPLEQAQAQAAVQQAQADGEQAKIQGAELLVAMARDAAMNFVYQKKLMDIDDSDPIYQRCQKSYLTSLDHTEKYADIKVKQTNK